MIELASQIRKQWSAWSCGPAALVSGFACYGERPDPRRVERAGGPECCNEGPKGGQCEHQLERAAKEFGFQLDHWIAQTPVEFYKTVRGFLDDRVPVLLCIEHYSHWVAVVWGNSRHAWVSDPARDGTDPIQRVTWPALARRATFGLPGEERF